MTFPQAQAVLNSQLLRAFVDPAADRCAYICAWLYAQHIPYRTVNLQDKTHIIITYNTAAYTPRYKTKTLTAHYDRDAHTAGANDNSAACIQLMLFAKRLLDRKDAHNIRIIFTDGEEAGSSGISCQGAYRLGQGLRALRMQHDDMFVFDMCGSGDILVMSQSGIYGRDPSKTQKLKALHQRCCMYAERSCSGQWISLPTAYSDNAGFISSGLTAQVITVLPKAEAEMLYQYLPEKHIRPHIYQVRKKKDIKLPQTALNYLEHCIITNSKPDADSPFAAIIPATWQRMHTPLDTLETLTPQSFVLIDRFLEGLATAYEPR